MWPIKLEINRNYLIWPAAYQKRNKSENNDMEYLIRSYSCGFDCEKQSVLLQYHEALQLAVWRRLLKHNQPRPLSTLQPFAIFRKCL